MYSRDSSFWNELCSPGIQHPARVQWDIDYYRSFLLFPLPVILVVFQLQESLPSVNDIVPSA